MKVARAQDRLELLVEQRDRLIYDVWNDGRLSLRDVAALAGISHTAVAKIVRRARGTSEFMTPLTDEGE